MTLGGSQETAFKHPVAVAPPIDQLAQLVQAQIVPSSEPFDGLARDGSFTCLGVDQGGHEPQPLGLGCLMG